jgi:hypothetical protein
VSGLFRRHSVMLESTDEVVCLSEVNYGQVKHWRTSSFVGIMPFRPPPELPRPSASKLSWKILQDGVRLLLAFFVRLPLLPVVESSLQSKSPFVLGTASTNRPPKRRRNLVIDLLSYAWYNGSSTIHPMLLPVSAVQWSRRRRFMLIPLLWSGSYWMRKLIVASTGRL